jgi:hypothetical protein
MFSALFCVHTRSWWGNAHVIIAENAQKYLTESQIANIEALIQDFGLPKQTLPNSAVWQDDLISANMLTTMKTWHYSDIPYVNSTEPFPYPLPNPTYNVTSYIDSAWKALNDPTTTDRWVWSFHLRSLIHFVADIHTPHHNIALFSEQFPEGDMGGNLYKITCEWGSACMNIHFMWDSVGLVYPVSNPTDPFHKEEIKRNASELQDEYPISSLPGITAKVNASEWSIESFEIAKSIGYATPMNEKPSDEYMRRLRQTAKKRVAMAGHRLGNMLKIVSDKGLVPVPEETNISSREIALWCVDGLLVLVIAVFGGLSIKIMNEEGYEKL